MKKIKISSEWLMAALNYAAHQAKTSGIEVIAWANIGKEIAVDEQVKMLDGAHQTLQELIEGNHQDLTITIE